MEGGDNVRTGDLHDCSNCTCNVDLRTFAEWPHFKKQKRDIEIRLKNVLMKDLPLKNSV